MPNLCFGIVGDFCADVYLKIDPSASEVSLETGLPTQPVAEQRFSLGGAGNVAANLISMGVGEVHAFGVVGADMHGERMIRLLGIEDCVDLLGDVSPRSAVVRELDEADMHVLTSRQEGLPRALIEAMGRGLPCIGSAVGGIPELLPSEDLVPPNDAAALANKIIEILADPQRMTHMSARNLEVAAEYRADVLVPRRRQFYQRLRELSSA